MAAAGPTSTSSGSRSGEHRIRLAALVEDVIDQLASPAEGKLRGAVNECNTALELYLEFQRDVDRDDRTAAASDDLRRLIRLLDMVERADVPLVLRRIRCVLGRLDS